MEEILRAAMDSVGLPIGIGIGILNTPAFSTVTTITMGPVELEGISL